MYKGSTFNYRALITFRWQEALRACAAVSKATEKINVKKGRDSLRYSTMTASRHQNSPRGTPRQHRKYQRKEDSEKKPLLSQSHK